jgi:mannan endo-1,4-beta-mannosidase
VIYGYFIDNTKITSELTFIKENKIPLVVGEFGYIFNKGQNNLGCKIDASLLLVTCQQLGIGYLAWSWSGNNQKTNGST